MSVVCCRHVYLTKKTMVTRTTMMMSTTRVTTTPMMTPVEPRFDSVLLAVVAPFGVAGSAVVVVTAMTKPF